MINFKSSSNPKSIDIEHFWNQRVAFVECTGDDYRTYVYLYAGSLDDAIASLTLMGFLGIEDIEEVEFTSEYFLVKRPGY